MKNADAHPRFVAVRRRGVALLAMAAALTASIGAGGAFAQSGGAAAPGDPAAPAPAASPSGQAGPYVFPIAGPHTYGQGFGAARAGHSHQGQDVMAACGTPLVAISRSRLIWNKFQGAAGNYIVLKDLASKQNYAYMHLLRRSPIRKRAVLQPGQIIGNVGRTGDATACHLHFELWTKKGYYRGGHPINPLLTLQAWDPTA